MMLMIDRLKVKEDGNGKVRMPANDGNEMLYDVFCVCKKVGVLARFVIWL